jgi:hypothetical protein
MWTDDGLPAIDAVRIVTGDSKVTRKMINDVALGLTRINVLEYVPLSKAANEVAEPIVVEATEEVSSEEADRLAQERASVIGFLQTATEQRLSDAEKLDKLLATGLTVSEIVRLVTKRNLKNVRVA